MSMEKRNVMEQRRTPDKELAPKVDWVKQASDEFKPRDKPNTKKPRRTAV